MLSPAGLDAVARTSDGVVHTVRVMVRSGSLATRSMNSSMFIPLSLAAGCPFEQWCPKLWMHPVRSDVVSGRQ